MADQPRISDSARALRVALIRDANRVKFLRQAVPPELQGLLNRLARPDPAPKPGALLEANVARLGSNSNADTVSDSGDDVLLEGNIARLDLANQIADLSDQNLEITQGILKDKEVDSVQSLARKYDLAMLGKLVVGDDEKTPSQSESSTPMTPPSDSTASAGAKAAKAFHRALYTNSTTASITGMLDRDELFHSTSTPTSASSRAVIAAPQPTDKDKNTDTVRTGLLSVLKKNPGFEFRNHSLSRILDAPGSFEGITDDEKPRVVAALKDLHIAQSLAPVPEALPTIFRSQLSAFVVAQQPEDQFVRQFGPAVGGTEIASQIHTHAVRTVARNDHALANILLAARGTGLNAIDGSSRGSDRPLPEQINLEKLFGSLDYCECSDCSSVTSPAAYYVELLQYLRNNNLDPSNQWSGNSGFSSSPLDYLFRRRPDLACLELTCANSNTVLPYIDLANEVLESFIVHQKRFAKSILAPKQSWIDIFNASDAAEGRGGSSAELLAVPQNVNQHAYEILDDAVYPAAKLPYNLPIDTIRQFLLFLSTNRAELMKSFQGAYTPAHTTTVDDWSEVPCRTKTSNPPPPCTATNNGHECDDSDNGSYDNDDESSVESEDGYGKEDEDEDCEGTGNSNQTSSTRQLTEEERSKLAKLHQEALDSAIAAEELGMTQEEYVIITKSAFWSKSHFDLRYNEEVSTAVYRKRIGVRKDWEYWGLDYTSLDDMFNLDEVKQTGLTFVKKQLLPRTGVLYSDLVDIIKTKYMNPKVPQGRAMVIMQSILFSYEYLASKIDSKGKNRKARLRKVLQLLANPASGDEEEVAKLIKGRLKSKTCCQTLFNMISRRENPDFHSVDMNTKLVSSGDSSGDCRCGCTKELRDWILCYFDSIGSILVLDNGQGQKILFEGDIFHHVPAPQNPGFTARLTARAAVVLDPEDYLLGHIHRDGRITESAESDILVGSVSFSGEVFLTDGVTLFMTQHVGETVVIRKTDPPSGTGDDDGYIDKDSLLVLQGPDGKAATTPWTSTYDDCDLTKVRLRRLGNKKIARTDYDKLHRFIRLWRKLDWTVGELDAAITAFGAGPTASPSMSDPVSNTIEDDVDYSDFQEPCGCQLSSCDKCNRGKNRGSKPGKYCDKCGNPRKPPGSSTSNKKYCSCGSPQQSTVNTQANVKYDLSPYFINQVAALKKLVDLTGKSLLQILSFWTSIDTFGPDSLYSKLFLTHNMLGLDSVFAPDANGLYLTATQTQAPKISDHRPVLLAAFQIRPADLDAIISVSKITDDKLNLENVSQIYRHALLSNILGVKAKDLAMIFETFKSISPWTSAQSALELIKLWNKISNAGFDFRQLAYIFDGANDPLKPIQPTTVSILKLVSTLYTSLKAIDSQYALIESIEQATPEALAASIQLLFDSDTVSQISAFLDGTRVYSTNAPKIDGIVIPVNLQEKLKYVAGDKPRLQSTGQLTVDEKLQAKRIVSQGSEPKWTAAIDRLSKQAVTFFKNFLSAFFDDHGVAQSALTAGDLKAPPDSTDPTQGTAQSKRFLFLQSFIPFLKKQLSTQTVVSTMAGSASIPNDIAGILLEDILFVGKDPQRNVPGTRALDAIQAIKNEPETRSSWKGYLVVNTSQKYTFMASSVADDNRPAAILIDQQSYVFSTQQDDPTDLWFGEPIKLIGGRLYELEVQDQMATQLQWMTDVSGPTLVPSSNLIPTHAKSGVEDILVLLIKASFFINNFALSFDEVSYFFQHGGEFNLDWSKLALDSWRRLNDYVTLRNSLPKSAKPLLQLFKWTYSKSPVASEIADQINEVTLWEQNDIAQLIAPTTLNLTSVSSFRDEIALLRMQKSLTVAKKVGIDIKIMFSWAKPVIRFSDSAVIANSIKTITRSQYSLSDWEKAIKPTYDTLRQNQSNALVGYLTVQPDLVAQGIIDSDSLFEFFLIDPSMCPCMETSRLKQATSSIQLFIQRCMLGLEDQDSGFGSGVDLNLLDRDRWKWMQRYRLWEANRKVFLFPENWIQPSLRDDKTPQYKAFESELMQKDINERSIMDAVKNYLFALDVICNLQVFSVYMQERFPKPTTGSDLDKIAIIHFFARTASSPYKYYYRTLDCIYKTWTSWQQMQIDIPSYEIERSGTDARSNKNGCFIVPFMHNGRLVVGLPQFMKKQFPRPIPADSFKKLGSDDNSNPANSSPLEYWEIKFGYTELLNGGWKQKVISTDGLWEAPVDSASLPAISEYSFVPEVVLPPNPPPTTIPLSTITYINVLRQNVKVGRFSFNGSRVVKDGAATLSQTSLLTFQVQQGGDSATTKSLQVVSGETSQEFSYPNVQFSTGSKLDSKIVFDPFTSVPFSHSFAHALLSSATNSINMDPFFALFQTVIPDVSGKNEAWGAPFDAPVPNPTPTYNELYRSYSTYNWELAFHIPMALADKLLEMQQFDLALKMCHFVFNPYAKGTGVSRYWQFPPFRDIDSINSIEKLFASLKPNESVSEADQINQWRDRPFEPHVLARLRPVAYMKWTVMKYIQILIAYGDWYFNQNTLEMIPMAIQCYVLASHIYGPRGQKIPRRGKKKAETYLTLLNKWDAFDNAMIQLELEFPFSNQIDKAWGDSNGVAGLANIFGFATNRYFCIPNNDQLTTVRDTIDDRMFKIRHCQDIKGVFRLLPLYEPPLDIGSLVTAVAQGLSLTDILNDLNASMPNYRFTWTLAKAFELVSELKALGGAFLSAKEKQDGEVLSVIRQQHDLAMQNLVMEQKKLALLESETNLAALQQSRKRPQYQLQHALKLLGEDASIIPGEDDEWKPLADEVPVPQAESGLKLSPEEVEELSKSNSAHDTNQATSIVQTISGELHALPLINAFAALFGVGAATLWGPPNIAQAMNGVAQVMKIAADSLSHESLAAGRKNSHLRTRQDRVLSANSQGLDLKNIDAQIATQQVRINICNQEITNQQKQLDNAQEILDYLTNKYTNKELYSFMEGRVRSIYYQIYQLAYRYARKAELCFRFERGVKESNFIQSGYWEPSHDGLLSGESLYMSLKNLEAAYHDSRGYDFEISKFVSLRQINPLALMGLRDTGRAEFAIPEILFDMDFPGHYLRKTRSVALTIPCVVGPYTTINATLRLTSHKYRSESTATDKRDYIEKIDDGAGSDRRFDTTNIPISAVAVSSGSNDSGVFDLNFKDERFMPFEGAGAISTWTLELPTEFRQFDYSSITDVILHLRYTARDGGAKLRDSAAGAVADYIKTVTELGSDGSGGGLYTMFDTRSDFFLEWQSFTHPAAAATERVLLLRGLNDRLPIYTKGRPANTLLAQDIWIATDAVLNPGDVLLEQGSNELDFQKYTPSGGNSDGVSWIVAHGECALSDWKVTVKDVGTTIGRMWIVVRYMMK